VLHCLRGSTGSSKYKRDWGVMDRGRRGEGVGVGWRGLRWGASIGGGGGGGGHSYSLKSEMRSGRPA